MTVAEVKETLQGAGVNLNDAQFAAIQSLLGSGGGGGDSSTEYGTPISDLTNPRYWLYPMQDSTGKPVMTKFENNTYTKKIYDFGTGDKSFLYNKDIFSQLEPYYNWKATEYYESVLTITQDKIPYVDAIIRHRLLDFVGNYGAKVGATGELSITDVITASFEMGLFGGLYIPNDWKEHLDDSDYSVLFSNYLRHPNVSENGGTAEELPAIEHPLGYRYSDSQASSTFNLTFVNINGDKFEGSNELIFVPLLTVVSENLH